MGCIIGNLKYIVKVADNIAKSKLNENNIPVLSQHIIIFHIIVDKHILFTDLQKELQCSKSTLSDAINKYEKLNFIKKIECDKDKRNLYISLTTEGKKILSKLVSIDNEIKEILFKNFNNTNARQLEQDIDQMMKNLK